MSTKQIDSLYELGKEQTDPFSFYWANLRPHLLKYAQTIGRLVTRQVEEHLLEEMVEDILMKIPEFNETSKFSTWAFVSFKNRFIDEYRYQEGNLGEDLEIVPDGPDSEHQETTLEQDVIVADFVETLTPRQRMIWEMYRDGYTQEEIGSSLQISQPRVTQIWEQILELGKEYGQAYK